MGCDSTNVTSHGGYHYDQRYGRWKCKACGKTFVFKPKKDFDMKCIYCGHKMEKIEDKNGYHILECSNPKCKHSGENPFSLILYRKCASIVDTMKITLIYDNEARDDLEADWGFSCLVEVENTPKILFDTGANGSILLSNMKKLNIDPTSIDEVFISHAHWDHVGGLSDLLKVNERIKVYVPISFKPSGAKEAIGIKKPTKIHENVFSTGELDQIEQSMAVKTEKGIIVIVGCSHPGVENILKASSKFGNVHAIIGGLHGFRAFDLFKGLELVCPCHCTQFKSKIKDIYPAKCIDGGAGKIISL